MTGTLYTDETIVSSIDPEQTLIVTHYDPDATIKKGIALPSRLYLRAVEIERANLLQLSVPTVKKGVVQQSRARPLPWLSLRARFYLVATIVLLLCQTIVHSQEPRFTVPVQQARVQLEQTISQARKSGVAVKDLARIIQAEQTIDHSLSQFTPGLYLQPEQAYSQQKKQYQELQKQLQKFIEDAKKQSQVQMNSQAKREASYQISQLRLEVEAWNRDHPYHNVFDGHDYQLSAGYMEQGTGSVLHNELQRVSTKDDIAAVLKKAHDTRFNFHMFTINVTDHTPYTQIHQTDLQILEHYNLEQKQVLIVSLSEQAMRIYENKQLQNAFLTVTGRQQLPSLPGVWRVLDRKSPAIFTSGEPKGSPYWFPDTPIQYAILYHYGGYFIHDASWRTTFGPGSQFPHQDAGGTTADNFDGSHGCVNLSGDIMKWVYEHTDWNTTIVIY